MSPPALFSAIFRHMFLNGTQGDTKRTGRALHLQQTFWEHFSLNTLTRCSYLRAAPRSHSLPLPVRTTDPEAIQNLILLSLPALPPCLPTLCGKQKGCWVTAKSKTEQKGKSTRITIGTAVPKGKTLECLQPCMCQGSKTLLGDTQADLARTGSNGRRQCRSGGKKSAFLWLLKEYTSLYILLKLQMEWKIQGFVGHAFHQHRPKTM